MKENQLMEAAIIKVDKGRFELKLSLRKSDTQPDPDKVRQLGTLLSASLCVGITSRDYYSSLSAYVAEKRRSVTRRDMA